MAGSDNNKMLFMIKTLVLSASLMLLLANIDLTLLLSACEVYCTHVKSIPAPSGYSRGLGSPMCEDSSSLNAKPLISGAYCVLLLRPQHNDRTKKCEREFKFCSLNTVANWVQSNY